MKTFVFFDVDGTLLRGNINSLLIWNLYKKRVLSSMLLFRALFWYALWQLGVYSDLNVIARKGARELAGVSQKKLDNMFDLVFDAEIRKKIYEEGERLIRDHQERGHEVILLSSSFEPFIRKIAEFFKLPYIATRLQLADDIYTGEIIGDIVGGNKHHIVRNYLSGHTDHETYAYTDHYQDLKLLEIVTYPFAVNPDSRLENVARVRKWPILHFSKVLGRT